MHGLGISHRNIIARKKLTQVSHGAIQFAVYEELKDLATKLDDFITPLGSTGTSSQSKLTNKLKNKNHAADDNHVAKRALTSAEITAAVSE